MQRTPFALLKFVTKAFLNAAGGGMLGDFAVEVVPDFCQDVWHGWTGETDAVGRRAELEALARASDEQIRLDVEALVCELAEGQPEPIRQGLTTYLRQIPASIRQSQRRPDDETGTSIRPGLALNKAEDLIPLLPSKATRFRQGDRPLPGTDWELVEWLGTGGFGEVWKARRAHLPGMWPVALKFCIDGQARRLLKHEFEIVLRVMREGHHPGIVALRDADLEADPPWLQYEFVEGGHLAGLISDWQADGNSADPIVVAKAVLEIADVVGFAHRLRPPIVHRDLKPANILVSRQGGVIRFKVTDFGIGGIAVTQARAISMRAADAAPSMTVGLRGSFTANYASPEQMEGGRPDPRDDVHALGVIWYQMLTGVLTRGRPGGAKWMQRFADRGMSRGLIDLLGSCFEDEQDDRPSDAGILVDRLRTLLTPPLAAPVEPPAELPKPQPPVQPKPVRSRRPTVRFADSIGIRLATIPAGSFLMGTTNKQIERLLQLYADASRNHFKDEQPQHPVEITRSFLLGIHEVTVAQFRLFVEDSGFQSDFERDGKGGYGWDEAKATFEQDPRYTWRNAGFPQGDDHPVVNVSWPDAIAFCEWLGAKDGRDYRLPTEAEWEYACRAPTQLAISPRTGKPKRKYTKRPYPDILPEMFTPIAETLALTLYPNGDDPERLADIANVADASTKRKYPKWTCIQADDGFVYTAPVGSFAPNGWGLYDMIGNVWEWCADAYDSEYYAMSPPSNPTGPPASEASVRVLRGGSWCEGGRHCRSAYRDGDGRASRLIGVGFRLAATRSIP